MNNYVKYSGIFIWLLQLKYSAVIKTLKQTSRQKKISFKENFINEEYDIR